MALTYVKASGIDVTGDYTVNNLTATLFLPNNSAEATTDLSISSGAVTVDLNTASVFTVSLTENITSITLSNVQSAGRSSSFVVVCIADGTARTVVWPASFKWPAGTAPTITSTSGKKDVFLFFTVDGGTTWQAFISGQDI